MINLNKTLWKYNILMSIFELLNIIMSKIIIPNYSNLKKAKNIPMVHGK
jgi:hypothetical protein